MHGVVASNQQDLAGANQTLTEAVSAIRTVFSFNMEDSISKMYHDQLQKASKGIMRKSLSAGFGFGFSQSTRFFIYALALYYGSTLMESGQLTFKDLNQGRHAKNRSKHKLN